VGVALAQGMGLAQDMDLALLGLRDLRELGFALHLAPWSRALAPWGGKGDLGLIDLEHWLAMVISPGWGLPRVFLGFLIDIA
jgi:hypothetical protein